MNNDYSFQGHTWRCADGAVTVEVWERERISS